MSLRMASVSAMPRIVQQQRYCQMAAIHILRHFSGRGRCCGETRMATVSLIRCVVPRTCPRRPTSDLSPNRTASTRVALLNRSAACLQSFAKRLPPDAEVNDDEGKRSDILLTAVQARGDFTGGRAASGMQRSLLP